MIDLTQLPQKAFNIAQRAIDLSFSLDRGFGAKANPYIRLFKGVGMGTHILLVGEIKVYFLLQIGDRSFETAEVDKLLCKRDQEEALRFLEGDFLDITPQTITEYISRKPI